MTNLPSSPMNSRLFLTELIWLEPEQIEQAKAMSEHLTDEMQQWQSYLNALALLGFEQWLSDRLPEQSIERSTKPIESVRYVEVNGFTVCLIAVEHVLDETVRIPEAVVERSELAAHFYVVHEVSEEQELVTVRGFCRYDELIRAHCQVQDGYYQLPLACLDAEPNHLLFYCRALQPATIALPISAAAIATDQFLVALTHTKTTLTQWLQGAFDQSWQAIDQLINPEADLVFNTRRIQLGVKRGKLINLGLQLGHEAMALLVNVTSEADGKLSVLVQLHPTGSTQHLTPNLKLSLRSSTGVTLQEVVSRSQDNYIQLKPIKGKSGTQFSLAIQLGSEILEENFEL